MALSCRANSHGIPMQLFLVIIAVFSIAAEPARDNSWVKLDKATIEGRRWDVPLGYAPDQKQFLVLGGRTSFGDYKKPRSHDVLTLDQKEGMWENSFPIGKNWGPRFGPSEAPGWKNEVFGFQDALGNLRPNWTVYGTFSLGQKYDYDPESKSFVFYAGGRTFRYDPAERTWADLAPKTDPQKEMGGILLWSSLCYDRHNKEFFLFGGGNVLTERGDPGTWSYSPSANEWKQLKLEVQPPARANSRLVYDPVGKKVILFGGDQLDQLLSDTWAFDVVARKWEQKKPNRSPSPRAGHAMLWLPKAKKVLLLGGYGYTSATGYCEHLYRRLPLEAWIYDPAADQWDLVKRFEGTNLPQGPTNTFLSAAVDADDNVLVLGDNGTWQCPLDVSKIDAAGSEKLAVRPGTTERRTGPHDPQWFKDGVPEPDPAKVEAELKALPVNQWVQRPTPKLPRPNMDWGSAVFAPELDLILRFSGGHSAYSGTAPQVYDIKNDRYSIPFTPEYPLEYVYSNDQVHGGDWSFKGNPWMTGHTYKSTGYDRNLKCLVFAPHEYSYFFDPTSGKWSRTSERNPYRPDFYNVTVCPTPKGAVVWAAKRMGGIGLWLLDAKTRSWKPLPLQGTLPAASPDQHGLAFDAKRDRLLFFSKADKNKGDVMAYDFKTGEARWLNATGKERAAAPSRETIYLADSDAVLIGARVDVDGKLCWLRYDCAKNSWTGIELPGADPIGKGTGSNVFNNSMGLMFDPNRKLVWAVGQNSHVHVIRIDEKTLEVHDLK